MYHSPHYCYRWRCPCDHHAIMLHGWKDNSMFVKSLAACTHLSSTVSQLFEPQVQKIAVFTYRSPHFCFPQYVAWMETQFNACQTPCSMYPSIINSFSVIRTASAKNRRFHVPQPTFLFPLERPCNYHPIFPMDEKTIQCLPNPSQHISIYLQ